MADNNSSNDESIIETSTDVKKAKKKKVMKKPNNKKDIDFEIMFKGQDGVVTSYKNEDEVVPKKNKKVKEGKI